MSEKMTIPSIQSLRIASMKVQAVKESVEKSIRSERDTKRIHNAELLTEAAALIDSVADSLE